MKNKSYLLNLIVVFSCICLFSSCIGKRQTTYLQRGKTAYSPVIQQEYRLRIDDEVSYFLMTSSPETQLLYNGAASSSYNAGVVPYRIYNDGMVHLPVGRVRLAGLTLREAENAVKNAFSRVVPDVEIRLTMINNAFYIQGDNGKGKFQIYKENLNIFQALALAGDISNMGDKKNIKIIRRGADGFDHIKTFDLREESIIESEYYYVMPNDVIYIPTNPNSFFRVDSVSSFMSMFITPVSFFMMVLTLFK